MIPCTIFGSLFMVVGLVWLVKTLARIKFPSKDMEIDDFDDWQNWRP